MKATTVSQYQITWVEIKATKGIATLQDRKAFGEILLKGKGSERSYQHFTSRELALEFIKKMQNTKLSKVFECRMFTDKQMGLRKAENNYLVPFTAKQQAEVYYI